MDHPLGEQSAPLAPALGIGLILVGFVLVLEVLGQETWLGVGAVVAGALVLLAEFA